MMHRQLRELHLGYLVNNTAPPIYIGRYVGAEAVGKLSELGT